MGVEQDQLSLAGDNLSLNSSITYLEYLYQGGDAAKSSKDKKHRSNSIVPEGIKM